uniref:Uncharacterized protein n=1 Tax=Oryza nivara TaxID=4536 RepID=A0A0E0JAY2_ORYNI
MPPAPSSWPSLAVHAAVAVAAAAAATPRRRASRRRLGFGRETRVFERAEGRGEEERRVVATWHAGSRSRDAKQRTACVRFISFRWAGLSRRHGSNRLRGTRGGGGGVTGATPQACNVGIPDLPAAPGCPPPPPSPVPLSVLAPRMETRDHDGPAAVKRGTVGPAGWSRGTMTVPQLQNTGP